MQKFKQKLEEKVILSFKTEKKDLFEIKIHKRDILTFKKDILTFWSKTEIPAFYFDSPENFLSRKKNILEGVAFIELQDKNNKNLTLLLEEIKKQQNTLVVFFLTPLNNYQKLDFVADLFFFPLATAVEVVNIGRELGLDSKIAPKFHNVVNWFLGLDREATKEALYEVYFRKKLCQPEEVIFEVKNYVQNYFKENFNFISYRIPYEDKLNNIYGYNKIYEDVLVNFKEKNQNQFLLIGSSGTGKTTFAYKVALNLKIPLLELNLNTLVKNQFAEDKLKQVFKIIESVGDCVLLLEDYNQYLSEQVINKYDSSLFSPVFYNLWKDFLSENKTAIVIATSKKDDFSANEKRLFQCFFSDQVNNKSIYISIIWNYFVNNKIFTDFQEIKAFAEKISNKKGLNPEILFNKLVFMKRNNMTLSSLEKKILC